jgi:hypothetical protein
MPNPKAGGSYLIGCPRLLIQYFRSYPPYLEAVSFTRNPKTRHAVVIRGLINMACHSFKAAVANLIHLEGQFNL